MKKFFITLLAVISITLAFTVKSSLAVNANFSNEQPVCRYSLSKYTGTVSYSSTDKFDVYLSCPVDVDTYPTVDVYIDGTRVASKVFKVPANQTCSKDCYVGGLNTYNGKNYTLRVL